MIISCDGQMLKGLMWAGLAWLEQNRERVNALNVFPVPDGDTGTNMVLTLRKAYEAIHDDEDSHVGNISYQLARGALMGARGNSGVILSQLIQGFARALRDYDAFDITLLKQACQQAVETAYDAVIEPTEGTILTVSRLTAEAVSQYEGEDLNRALDVMLQAAEETLQSTPELLPVLKKAGVVDSGGQGLVFILVGMSRFLRGEPVTDVEVAYEDNHWLDDLEPEDEEGYGYDVQFLMHGHNMDVGAVRTKIDSMGWSTLVVGDAEMIKVHVHVHDPDEPIDYARSYAESIDDIVIENMQEQYEAKIHKGGVAVVTVARGDGFMNLFYEGLGAAYVVSGGQSMNPDTSAFVEAIRKLPNQQIVILPNNGNIVMAAQQAADVIEDKDVRVIPTKTIPQGISAMVTSIDLSDDLEQMVATMHEAMAFVITCEVTSAVRAAHFDTIDVIEGQFIGLVDNELVSSADTLQDAVIDTLRKAGTDEHELVTLYYGDTIHDPQARELVQHLKTVFTKQEFEIVYGGQPLYPYIISIE